VVNKMQAPGAGAWAGGRILVTGGASFIGSHLTDALVSAGANVRVVDDLSSGTLTNLDRHLRDGSVEFVHADLLEPGVAQAAVKGTEVVFHLAANHGGRGYIDTHQGACATNLALDGIVFKACVDAGVRKVVYASSGCVYPTGLQDDPTVVRYLDEGAVGPPYEADKMYGWAKLMGEMSLRAFHQEWGLASVSCRYFTAYGPRAHVNHAVMAMIARAFTDQDPFEVWGTGEQIRNWTHVSDIVAGTLLAAEHIDDGTGVNIGTMERTRVIDAARAILRYLGKDHLAIELHPEMPSGPLNRVADNSLAKSLLGWEPAVPFATGLGSTIDWFVEAHDVDELRAELPSLLSARTAPSVSRRNGRALAS